MHTWLSPRNMEQLQKLFCLTGPGHWWDGWLPSSRRHQQLILRIFIHLQDPPLFFYTSVCRRVHAFIYASEICMFSVQCVRLCRWKTCRASTFKEWSHCLVTAFSGSEGTVILLISMFTLKAGRRVTQTYHYLCSPDIQAFSSRLTFILQTV